MTTINDLILQGESFISQITNAPAHPGIIRMFSVYEITKSGEYEEWKERAKRFIGINYPNDKSISEFEHLCSSKLSPKTHEQMLAILKALAEMPVINAAQNGTNANNNFVIHNNINQTQNLEITNAVNVVFMESIKDELTGKQLKEIRNIIDDNKDKPEQAKSKIIEKLKSFGENVLSNIIANIITNPNIYDVF